MAGESSLLAALELLHGLDRRVTLRQIMAFLYVAEDEGLTVQQVADRAGFSQSTASRSLRANGAAGVEWALPPALGLIDVYLGAADARSHTLLLSPKGQQLRTHLDGLLALRRPLARGGAPGPHLRTC